MDYIYFNNYDGYSRDDYHEFCLINDIEFDETDDHAFWEWCKDEADADWDNILWEIKHYDKTHYGNYFVDANLGLWNGNRNGFNVFNSLEKAFWACCDNMDYLIIEGEKNGDINITAIHHDGTNHFTIKKITDEAYDRYDEWLYRTDDEPFELTDEDVLPILNVA